MAKKPTNTKTIIIVATSVVVAVGIGFLINKLVKDNKKKKEEEKKKEAEAKQKQDELDALKQMNSFLKSGANIIKTAPSPTKPVSEEQLKEIKNQPIFQRPFRVM